MSVLDFHALIHASHHSRNKRLSCIHVMVFKTLPEENMTMVSSHRPDFCSNYVKVSMSSSIQITIPEYTPLSCIHVRVFKTLPVENMTMVYPPIDQIYVVSVSDFHYPRPYRLPCQNICAYNTCKGVQNFTCGKYDYGIFP